CQHYDSTPYSF
nr:immunoglobulin light chain junction region [Macaca mulatta]